MGAVPHARAFSDLHAAASRAARALDDDDVQRVIWAYERVAVSGNARDFGAHATFADVARSSRGEF